MAKKRPAIVLDRLARQDADKLDSMLAELTRETAEAGKPARWSRRFAASGKNQLIKPFRNS
jgi:hypothetical protein